MAKKKRRKRSGRVFYPVYACFVILGIAAIAIIMRTLWTRMEDYESSVPKYVAERVEKIFTSRDFHTLYRYEDTALYAAEGEDAYVDYLMKLTEGQEITCHESFSMEDNEKKYQVKYGSNKLGGFTLVKSGEKTPGGNDLWVLKEMHTSVITAQTYEITVPETSAVYANDMPLGAEQVVESGINVDDSYLPAGFSRASWCTYSVERCFGVPAFRVVDVKGRTQRVIPRQEGGLTVQMTYDDQTLKPEMEEYVVTVAKAFARFTSDDGSEKGILQYVKNDTNAHRYIRGFDGGWFLNHRKNEFENMRTEKYVSYGDDAFSCDVFFDYVITYRKTVEVYPTGYTFFFEKADNNWLLFDFSINTDVGASRERVED